MKVRTTVLLLLMLCIGATLCFAADPSLGTWKLNEAKSKIDPGLPKNVTVVYEVEGNNIKSTVDGFDGKGNPVHSVWTGGKVLTTGRIAIAADGKSRTLTASGTNASGKKMHSTSVYDKQ